MATSEPSLSFDAFVRAVLDALDSATSERWVQTLDLVDEWQEILERIAAL